MFDLEIKEGAVSGVDVKITFDDGKIIIVFVDNTFRISSTVFKIVCQEYRRQGKHEELEKLKLIGFDYRKYLRKSMV